jgi:hypothetical protein
VKVDHHLEIFFASVRRRLEKSAAEYGDRSSSREPRELLAEIREKVADIAGWGAILWRRLDAFEGALGRLTSAVAEQRQHQNGAEPDVQDQLGDDHPLGLPSGKVEDGPQVGEQPAHGGDDRVSGPADPGDRAERALHGGQSRSRCASANAHQMGHHVGVSD